MSGSPAVHHFSTFPHGGAGNAALGIHHGLQRVGVTSQFFYRRNEMGEAAGKDCTKVDFPTPQRSPGRLKDRFNVSRQWAKRVERQRVRKVVQQYQAHLENNDRHTEVYSQAEEVTPTLAPEALRSGILHLHWTAYGFDWPSFFSSLPERLPIVWTLHDQNPFTGGCHYTTGCENFAEGCGNCPQIQNSGPRDLSAHSFRIKSQALSDRILHVVSPSLWLLQQAKRSPIFQAARTFTHIPYGIDAKQFQPANDQGPKATSAQLAMETASQRNLLPTIMLGAQDLANPRKGITQAIQTLQQVAARNSQPFRLWTFGNPLPESLLKRVPENWIVQQWGFIADRVLQGRLYRKADAFLMPSLEDNQPQTALESMLHGTPVVAFTIGGVPEVVRDGVSGFCVPAQDTSLMAERLLQILTQPQLRRQLGHSAALQIRQEHDDIQQAREYLRLYQSILHPAGTLRVPA